VRAQKRVRQRARERAHLHQPAPARSGRQHRDRLERTVVRPEHSHGRLLIATVAIRIAITPSRRHMSDVTRAQWLGARAAGGAVAGSSMIDEHESQSCPLLPAGAPPIVSSTCPLKTPLAYAPGSTAQLQHEAHSTRSRSKAVACWRRADSQSRSARSTIDRTSCGKGFCRSPI
jgi:hypothetical protein